MDAAFRARLCGPSSLACGIDSLNILRSIAVDTESLFEGSLVAELAIATPGCDLALLVADGGQFLPPRTTW